MSELNRLAAAFGVATEYRNVAQEICATPEDTVREVLQALGADASDERTCQAEMVRRQREYWAQPLPTIWTMREGRTGGPWTHHPEGHPPLAWISLEDGGRRYDVVCEQRNRRATADGVVVESQLLLPADIPQGWHRACVQQPSGDIAECPLVVAPARLPDAPRSWGFATQIYSLRGSRSWGLGDLQDLTDFGVWAATELGADFVLINPMHAEAPAPPLEDSPYLPTTRRFGNPIYIRPESVPEFAYLPPAEIVRLAAISDALRELNQSSDLLDRDRVWAAKQEALRAVFAVPRSPARQAEFEAFKQREQPDLDVFAAWCVLAERYGPYWDAWPEAARAEQPDDDRMEFHRWLQWLFDEQLEAVQRELLQAGMSIGVVQDLAIGVDVRGAETWIHREVLTEGFHVGAPPDFFNPRGQDWTQPPWNPAVLDRDNYRPFRDILRWILRHGGGLRIDHVVGLFRLWWIPAGSSPADGTYVRYNHETFIDILTLEAARAGVTLIGEDLGTVEPWARDYLADRGILGTTVMLFERDGAKIHDPSAWRTDCLASVTVHDLPPTAEYLRGSQLRLRESLGILGGNPEEAWKDHAAEVQAWVNALREEGLLPAEGDPTPEQITEAMHRMMARAPSRLLCLSLVDGVGERRTQNQPGTRDEYPNWRIPLCDAEARPVLTERLGEYPMLRKMARALSR